MSYFKRVGAMLPRSIVDYFGKELVYAGMHIEAKKFTGVVFSYSLVISATASFVAFVLLSVPVVQSFLAAFLLCWGAVYYRLTGIADGRGSFVEKILPDALQLIASNIKAGLTTERALFISARPEFGVLSEELIEASKRVLAGEKMHVALSAVPNKIKSEVLERTIWLVTQGIKNGGQISELLLQLSDDLRLENSLKEETNANISLYIIMILAAAAVGAPMLFAISSFIVQVLTIQVAALPYSPEQFAELSGKSPVGGFVGIPKIAIKPDFIVYFSLIVLVVTTVFSSLTIGIINKGYEKAGVKYIPFILALDLLLFFAARMLLTQIIGKSIGL